MDQQKPSVGRVVHYYGHPGQKEPWAAFVTKVHGDFCINVAGFNDGGTQFSQSSATYSEEPSVSCRWVWPPRV